MARFAVSVFLSLLISSLGFGQARSSGSRKQASSASSSQSANSGVQQDPTAMTVVVGSLAAMGSSTTTIAMDSIAQGTMTFADGSTATMTIKSRGTALLRHDIDFGASQISYVVNTGAGYKLDDGTKETLPLHVTAYQRVDYIPAFSRLTESGGSSTNLSYVGLEQLPGGPAYHVELTNAASDPRFVKAEALNSEFHAFIDAKTNLVVETTSFLFSPDAIENRIAVETCYSDYRTVSGVMVPFHATRFIRGTKYSDLQLSSVQIGNALNSDSDFQ